MNFLKILYVCFFIVFEISDCEINLQTCSENQPFRSSDSTCQSFEDVCVKKEDQQCNNLIKACKQCPSTNYTLPALWNTLNLLKNFIYEIKQNQTTEFKTLKEYFDSMKGSITNEINSLKGQINKEEIGKWQIKFDQLLNELSILKQIQNNESKTIQNSFDSIKSFIISEISYLKIQLNNKTQNLTKEIIQFSNDFQSFKQNKTVEMKTMQSTLDTIKGYIEKEINSLKVQLNNNETLQLRKKIEQLANNFDVFKTNYSAEIKIMQSFLNSAIHILKSQQNNNKTQKLEKIIYHHFVPTILFLIAIAIISIAVLIFEIKRTKCSPRLKTNIPGQNNHSKPTEESIGLIDNPSSNQFVKLNEIMSLIEIRANEIISAVEIRANEIISAVENDIKSVENLLFDMKNKFDGMKSEFINIKTNSEIPGANNSLLKNESAITQNSEISPLMETSNSNPLDKEDLILKNSSN